MKQEPIPTYISFDKGVFPAFVYVRSLDLSLLSIVSLLAESLRDPFSWGAAHQRRILAPTTSLNYITVAFSFFQNGYGNIREGWHQNPESWCVCFNLHLQQPTTE